MIEAKFSKDGQAVWSGCWCCKLRPKFVLVADFALSAYCGRTMTQWKKKKKTIRADKVATKGWGREVISCSTVYSPMILGKNLAKRKEKRNFSILP